jgi:predicted amidohydrolase YtcJ
MILLENGYFHLPDQPNFTSMLVENGRIVATSRSRDHPFDSYNIQERYDLKGRVVWPGFTDSHIHLTSFGLNLMMVNCETDSLQECLKRVENAAIASPRDAWILGHGWNQNSWQGGYGTASQLDAVSHGHPVYLTAKSLHAGWANSLVLQIANITRVSPEPAGGLIMHDDHGDPTGIMIEKATELITAIVPKQTPDEITFAIQKGVHVLNQMGVTSVHDFDSLSQLEYYQLLEQKNQLCLRIQKIIPPDDHQSAMNSGYRTGMGDNLIHIGSYKLFMDGALGPHTAAMIGAYNDDPYNHGILNYSAKEVFSQCKDISRNGSDISIHAIGDRANQAAISAFRLLKQFENKSGYTPVNKRIEHVQLIPEENLADFREVGIIASMQPLHATSDMKMADQYWGERTRYAYAWKSLLEHNTRLIFGSDAPVDSPNPFWGLHAAVTRQDHGNTPMPDGWIPNERITLDQALEAYTTGPAVLNKNLSASGRLEPGSNADMFLLAVDPFLEKAQELHRIKPVATMFNGKWVWVDQGIDL